MIQSVSPQRAQRQKYIPSPSLITDYSWEWRTADTMLTSSLDHDVLHILWCRLVCRNFVSKDRVN